MRKSINAFFAFVILLSVSNIIHAQNVVHRTATYVYNTHDTYNPENWIISPTEESGDYYSQYGLEECEINSVTACYDNEYLRVDIVLNSDVTYKWKTLYAIQVEYSDMTEYYIYYTDDKQLIYVKEVDGRVVKTEDLTFENSKDIAGVTSWGERQHSDIYFIINKDLHIGGEEGKRYYLTCSFYSGYVDVDDKTTTADVTMPVEIEFEF